MAERWSQIQPLLRQVQENISILEVKLNEVELDIDWLITVESLITIHFWSKRMKVETAPQGKSLTPPVDDVGDISQRRDQHKENITVLRAKLDVASSQLEVAEAWQRQLRETIDTQQKKMEIAEQELAATVPGAGAVAVAPGPYSPQ
jgi:hypothetical protein